MREINLLPPEERGLLPRPWRERLPFLPLVLVALVSISLAGLDAAKIYSLQGLQAANTRLEAHYAPYLALLAKTRAQTQTVSLSRSLVAQVGSSLHWSVVAAELESQAPSGTVLSALTPAKGTLTVSGTVPDLASLALYLTRIPNLSYLGQPSLLGTQASSDGNSYTFSLQIPLKAGVAP